MFALETNARRTGAQGGSPHGGSSPEVTRAPSRRLVDIGLDLHDAAQRTHLGALVQYGSGMRTGQTNDRTLPAHVTVDVSLRHVFDVWGLPEAAVDLLNVGDERWAYRIGNASIVGSAYAPLRRVFGRVTWHLP